MTSQSASILDDYTSSGNGTLACDQGQDVVYPEGAPGFVYDPTGYLLTLPGRQVSTFPMQPGSTRQCIDDWHCCFIMKTPLKHPRSTAQMMYATCRQQIVVHGCCWCTLRADPPQGQFHAGCCVHRSSPELPSKISQHRGSRHDT